MKYLHLLLVGAFVNSVGTGMTAFGLAIFAYTTYGTASSVALVQLCAFAPIILLAPVAGALADRFDRRLMMVIGDGGSVLGLGVVMAALSASEPRLSHILTGVVVSSCLAALTEPALRASVTDLVDEDDYVRSAGLLQAASSARYLLSPLLAGLLLPLVGLRGCWPWTPPPAWSPWPARSPSCEPWDIEAPTTTTPLRRTTSWAAGAP